jgi:hypothetical protein
VWIMSKTSTAIMSLQLDAPGRPSGSCHIGGLVPPLGQEVQEC